MKQQAKAFAEKAHQGQMRKNSKEAYVTHPIRVAERLEGTGCSDEVVCAGYLHDVVEDTPFEIEDIKTAFGPKVATLVASHTENKSKSWQERKQHTIDTAKTSDKEVKYLIIADKLDNLLGLEKDLNLMGDAVWEHFNAGFDQQKWYNESVAHNMYVGLEEIDIPAYFREYDEAVKRVFGSG